MLNHRIKFAATVAGQSVILLVFWGSDYVFSQPGRGQEPVKPEAKEDTLKQLCAERLAVLREIVKQTTEAYNSVTADYQELSAATQAMLQAELERSESDKERVAVLERIVAQAKEAEHIADQYSKTGASQSPRSALKARADRLQAEIELEKAKTKLATQAAVKPNDQTAIAEHRIAIQQAALKLVEAQKEMAVAKVESSNAQLAAAQAAESFADAKLQRYLQLSKSDAVVSNVIDEQRQQFEAAKARRIAAESEVKQCEAQVLLEDAHVEGCVSNSKRRSCG